jgi:hypothetical protein
MAYVIQHDEKPTRRWVNALGEDTAAFETLAAAQKKLDGIRREIDRDEKRSGITVRMAFRIVDPDRTETTRL